MTTIAMRAFPARKRTTIVCIMRALSPTGETLPATIYTRGIGGKPSHVRQQYLNRETRKALGDDCKGHFEAEFVGNVWMVERRIPDSNW